MGEHDTRGARSAPHAGRCGGDFVNRLRQWLVGGRGAGQNLETGFLTNPVTGFLMGGPGEAIDAAAELSEGAVKLASKAARAPFSAAKASEAGRAITQTLAPEVADTAVSTTRRAATTGGATTTSITPREVLQHAADEGISLTPAQGLQTSAAKSEQTLGEEALLTGNKIKEAVAQSKSKLGDALDKFQDRLDPQRVGLSPEAAGEHLQNSAEIA